MFDIGFTELLLIGVVALIVIGPEKLPTAIRTGIKYFRQFKSGVGHVRDEVERELALDELKSDLTANKESLRESVGYNEIDDLKDSLNELKKEADNFYTNPQIVDEVSDAQIEVDLQNLSDDMGSLLPDGDAEAATGVEVIKAIAADKPKQKKLKVKAKKKGKKKNKSKKQDKSEKEDK